jgi:chorismate lyase / 3-hydroxybenzoate synthase
VAPSGAEAGSAASALSPAAPPPALALSHPAAAAARGVAEAGWPLATLRYGPQAFADGAGLTLEVPLAPLTAGSREESWRIAERPLVERRGPLALAVGGGVLFAAIELPAAGGGEREANTREGYRLLLSASLEAGYPHPLRFWNVLPAINHLQDFLERYRRFCRGRAEAFEEHFGAGFTRLLCASSAVGSAAGPLLVYLLAAGEPGGHLENPRQVSAYHYPPEYGPRSPSFARATRAPARLGGSLLLSGTASIVGHRTVHDQCVGCQLAETLRNLRVLAGSPEEGAGGVPFRSLKVYLRHPEHLPAVRQQLEQELGPDLPILYLQADICRRELLLEIEGVA